MVKKLTAHGNSAALVIDKPIMELLHITMDTPLDISTDGKNLIISPVSDPKRAQEAQKAFHSVKKRFGRALKNPAS